MATLTKEGMIKHVAAASKKISDANAAKDAAAEKISGLRIDRYRVLAKDTETLGLANNDQATMDEILSKGCPEDYKSPIRRAELRVFMMSPARKHCETIITEVEKQRESIRKATSNLKGARTRVEAILKVARLMNDRSDPTDMSPPTEEEVRVGTAKDKAKPETFEDTVEKIAKRARAAIYTAAKAAYKAKDGGDLDDPLGNDAKKDVEAQIGRAIHAAMAPHYAAFFPVKAEPEPVRRDVEPETDAPEPDADVKAAIAVLSQHMPGLAALINK